MLLKMYEFIWNKKELLNNNLFFVYTVYPTSTPARSSTSHASDDRGQHDAASSASPAADDDAASTVLHGAATAANDGLRKHRTSAQHARHGA